MSHRLEIGSCIAKEHVQAGLQSSRLEVSKVWCAMADPCQMAEELQTRWQHPKTDAVALVNYNSLLDPCMLLSFASQAK